jgi:NAD(P)-dependent dehydrogenase (short-subunit alcohol dehydrogenase family)
VSTVDKKTIVITGSNAGIGLAIAKQAAIQKQRIILACRSASKAETARRELLKAAPNAEILFRPLDLSSFDSIRSFATAIEKEFPALDVLINNAGVLPLEQQYTQEGFEMQFGVNYLGHFLLTHLLLPALAKAPRGRIIHVSSVGHFVGRINFDTFRGRKFYFLGLPSYAQSKLANVLLSHELSWRLPRNITSNAVHPGFVDSDFFRNIPGFIYKIWRKVLVSPEQCGQFITGMALSETWEGKTGQFVSAQGPLPISSKTRDVELTDRLYNESCRLAGVVPITGGSVPRSH